jgi:hypothetical protein
VDCTSFAAAAVAASWQTADARLAEVGRRHQGTHRELNTC